MSGTGNPFKSVVGWTPKELVPLMNEIEYHPFRVSRSNHQIFLNKKYNSRVSIPIADGNRDLAPGLMRWVIKELHRVWELYNPPTEGENEDMPMNKPIMNKCVNSVIEKPRPLLQRSGDENPTMETTHRTYTNINHWIRVQRMEAKLTVREMAEICLTRHTSGAAVQRWYALEKTSKPMPYEIANICTATGKTLPSYLQNEMASEKLQNRVAKTMDTLDKRRTAIPVSITIRDTDGTPCESLGDQTSKVEDKIVNGKLAAAGPSSPEQIEIMQINKLLASPSLKIDDLSLIKSLVSTVVANAASRV